MTLRKLMIVASLLSGAHLAIADSYPLIADSTEGSLAAGERHGLAISNGIPWAWGDNGGFQLGVDGIVSRSTADTVADLSGVDLIGGVFGTDLMIDGGAAHTVLRDAARDIFSWGDNRYGQLGDGTNTSSSIPVPLNFASSVLDGGGSPQTSVEVFDVVAGADFSTAVIRLRPSFARRIISWGRNDRGQLGRTTTTTCLTPVGTSVFCGLTADLVSTFVVRDTSKLAAGRGHTLITYDHFLNDNYGTVFAWGDDTFGQLGDGLAGSAPDPDPGQVRTGGAYDGDNDDILELVSDVAAGATHSLALQMGGVVYSWGGNAEGQLGNGTIDNSSLARRTSGADICGLATCLFATAIAAGENHSLALKDTGTIFAWGSNAHGQLGNSSIGGRELTPTQVVGLTDVIAIAAKGNTSYAMKSDGTVWAWGANDFGQLGNATSLYSGTPVQVVRGNRPPVAVDDIFVVERSRPETMFLLSNDQDLDGDDLAYVIVTQPAQGMLNDSSIYDSLVVYTYTGLTCGDTDSFTYKANDGQADSNIGTVGISIDCAPTANDDFYSTPYETSLSVSLPGLLQNDVDLDGQNIFIPYGIPEPECNFFLPGDPERYYYQCELITQGGRVTYLSSGGAFIYVPNDGFSGQDSFLYTVSDGDYSSSGTVIIQIDDPSQDTVPPVITILGENPTTVEAGSIYVDAGATAFDDVDQDVTSIIVTGNNVHTGELGAQFVTYDVSDLAGNIATQVVRIVNVEDTTPPVLSVPPALTVEAIGELSLVNIGTANATDVFPVTITNDAPDAGFPLGLTIVNWTAIDGNGNTTAATQNVTVVDTTPPELLVPADVTVEATGPQTDVDIGLATASDIFEVTITNDALASYPLGTTEVTWTATDANANRVSAVQRVIVVDATSPELSLSVSPTVLWPPNHKLSPIEVITSATDAVDPNPVVTLTIVLSSEGDSEDTFDTAFDVTEVVGKKGDDIQLIDGQLYLRAERAGNSDGRVYTITYEATDYSGNSVTGSATVEVPHNQ